MANSHLVEGLARLAREDQSSAAPAGEALMKAVRLLFHDGDPTRPCCYEHYDPITGMPAIYRGYDDYMHSWVVDQILRLAAGVMPGSVEVHPLPLGVDWINVTNIPNQGRLQSVRIREGLPAESSWE
jgi:hypothetical protein